jgi:uncharacterized protein (DUF2237 family)
MSDQYAERYETVLQPGDSWMVWDRLWQQPASHGEASLVALERAEAVSLCLLMNASEAKPPRPRPKAANDG